MTLLFIRSIDRFACLHGTQKDLKIVRISPLVSDMLPKPAVTIALDMLASTQGQRQPSPDDDNTQTE